MTSTPITLPYGYTPRSYQLAPLQALDKGVKRLIWVMHRRGGKDLTIFNWVIKTIAIGKPQTVWYVFPTYAQAKMVIWDGMTKDGRKYLDYIPECLIAKKNQQELKITFNNGSTFRLIGSDNVDRLVGAGPHIVVFSEASLHDPRAWEYIRPMIVETNGIAIFIGTPRGKNKFYEMFLHAQSDPDWYAQLLTIEDTQAVSQAQIDKERRDGMSEEMILQEYYCSWDSSIEGAYYSRILSTMRKSGQIGRVPYNPDLLVYTCWDLGFTDSMVITFFQKHGEVVRIIDHYENHGYQLSHYLQELKKKPYVYGQHFAPHDGAAHDRTGNTFIQKAREYGVDFTLLQDRYTILEGIERVRSMLNNTYIDQDNCDRLILALEHYRSEYDPIKQSYNKKPLHDWSSHSCFVGDTLVLTRYGECQIMSIKDNTEILTLQGWKKCTKAYVIQRNAKLVEIKFVDGTKVKCTLDHLFLTAKGWISAENLEKGSKIQSSLTCSQHFLKEVYTDYGQVSTILKKAVQYFIGMFGKMHLVKSLKDVISIIKIMLSKTIVFTTSNVFQLQFIDDSRNLIQKDFRIKLEQKQLNGINPKKEKNGIGGMQKDQRVGLSGKKNLNLVNFAIKNLIAWLGKMGIHKSFVRSNVNQLIIEEIKHLNEREDVYCIYVPEINHFSLSNGAIVHNCDAIRYLAQAVNQISLSKGMTPEDIYRLRAEAEYQRDRAITPNYKKRF